MKRRINLTSFKQKASDNASKMRRFLSKIEKTTPKNFNAIIQNIENEVWTETDCTTCGNCCNKMTPTYKQSEIKRIATHFNMTTTEFKEKWLMYHKKDKHWVNQSTPCQFFNKKTHLCDIYEIRPVDCADFPHLNRKPAKNYIQTYKNNIQYCPATYKLVEKLNKSITNLTIPASRKNENN